MWRIYLAIVCAAFIVWLPLRAPDSLKASPPSAWTDITISATPDQNAPPVTFTATYVTDTLVALEWTNAPSANQTMVRMAIGRYPESTTDGVLIYQGEATSANDTAIYFDEITTYAYYRAWSYNGTDYSTSYAEDYAGGDVTALADVLEQFLPLVNFLAEGLIPVMLLFGFSLLAFWRLSPVLFLMLAAISLMSSFYAPDFVTGGVTNGFSLTVGMLMLVYSFLSIGLAYWFLFHDTRRTSE